jgi:hypothetical protein
VTHAVMPSEGDRMWKLLLLVTLGAEALLLMRLMSLGSRCRAFPPFYTRLVVLGFATCSIAVFNCAPGEGERGQILGRTN